MKREVPVDIVREIKVVGVTSGPDKGRVYTRGMEKFGCPNLRIDGVPLFLQGPACDLLNDVAHGLVNEGVEIRHQDIVSYGRGVALRFEYFEEGKVPNNTRWMRILDTAMEGSCSNPHCKVKH